MPPAIAGRWDDEDGAVAVFVVGLTLALLMVAGLVFDGGRILAARREVHAVADNAARAGAQAVDLDALRSGRGAVVQAVAAEAAARAHLERVDLTGTVVVRDDTVRVEVSGEVPLVLLRMVGLHSKSVSGVGEARIVAGITGPGA